MFKRIVLIILSLAVTLSAVAVGAVFSHADAPMAYNLYGNPNQTGTSGRYDTFSIDFSSGITPNYTYWALCNFSMYLPRATTKVYKNITGGGGYAGLQNTSVSQGRVSIMSFWQWEYIGENGQKTIMKAKRMYPEGESTFDNEGSGVKCIGPYKWEDNVWYRMVLHSWEDAETGTTFAGQWLENLETGEWTLFCYYDTHLYQSAFTGGMSYFMENYWTTTYDQERELKVKNIYAHDASKKDWFSFDTYTLSYGDGGNANKFGAHTFGATDEYFWGKAGGPVDNQDEYEKNSVQSAKFTINQPKLPTFSEPALEGLKMDGSTLTWTAKNTSAPQISYEVEIVDVQGNKLFSKAQTRPEVTSCDVGQLDTDAYKVTVLFTDIFGEQTSAVLTTEAYDQAGGDVTPSIKTPKIVVNDVYDSLVSGFSNPQNLTNPVYIMITVQSLVIIEETDPTTKD